MPERLQWSDVEWRETERGYLPFLDGREIIWAAQGGSQRAFLDMPLSVFEVLLEGPRGGGKTDALLMDFGQHVGQGFGREWRGILFRQTFKQLEDAVEKTRKWFPRIWPFASFNSSDMWWEWPTGEKLLMRYMEREDDYWNYHGHAYPWIAFEELTSWPDDKCYRKMMACSRSTRPGMPRKYRATTNPYGPGHSWVKMRFKLPVPPGQIIGDPVVESSDPEDGPVESLTRIAVHSRLEDNQVLLKAEPNYRSKIRQAASSEAEAKAWLGGSWDIVAGGMFDDVWLPEVHRILNLPWKYIPRGWRINRSYDHGQSKPFSVGWWAESNGEPLEVNLAGKRFLLGAVRGDLFRVAEWYGWNGKPNEGVRMMAREIGQGIRDREIEWGIRDRVRPGPADTSIFDDFEPGKSVAGDMAKVGVSWTKADKGPGSRKQGWNQIRKLLLGALPGPEGVREVPGLFICSGCEQFVRTFPVLPRSKKDLDDVDTEAEDHIADEVRYRCREKNSVAGCQDWSGEDD